MRSVSTVASAARLHRADTGSIPVPIYRRALTWMAYVLVMTAAAFEFVLGLVGPAL